MKRTAKVSSLDVHLGYWLRLISNHVSYAFRAKVEAHGVTVAEWVVLRALFDREGVRPSDLGNAIGLTRGAISKLVDRLIQKGLVVCAVDRADRRAQLLALTPAGRKLVPLLAGLADQNDLEMFGPLDTKEQKLLATLLKRLVEHHGIRGAAIE